VIKAADAAAPSAIQTTPPATQFHRRDFLSMELVDKREITMLIIGTQRNTQSD
jgi:hypothetical protein